MNIKTFTITVISLLIFQSFAFADRPLNRAEILQIFQTLTGQPRRTWIPAGTIEASHQAYTTSEGFMTDSTVIVKSGEDKFYWEINIDSHIKQNNSSGNSLNTFDINRNKKRIFTWDGQKYTMYFQSGNQAIVTESNGNAPAVNGPLTAGVVPWGYGVYTYKELSAADSSGEIDAQGLVHLTINHTNLPERSFILDPTKNYAVLSYLINSEGLSLTTNTYGSYELISGIWMPAVIIIERYKDTDKDLELLSYDYWTFTSVSISPPEAEAFSTVYEPDTLVEYFRPATQTPLSYRYSSEVDTEGLLQDKIEITLAGDAQTRNCATVAMKYVTEQLGTNITDEDLVGLVDEPTGSTSLYDLNQFAQQQSFYCLAGKTDIQTLRSLNGCQVILHLPEPKHYVVLDHIDDEYVWIIDLDNDKFYYRIKIDHFGLDWPEGTTLLISSEPLNPQGNFTELKDEQMHEIIGSAGGSVGNFSCTDLIQEYNIAFCTPIMGSLCDGRYQIWYNRYGCESTTTTSSCTGDGLVGSVFSPCVLNAETLDDCIITGTWYNIYMHACK